MVQLSVCEERAWRKCGLSTKGLHQTINTLMPSFFSNFRNCKVFRIISRRLSVFCSFVDVDGSPYLPASTAGKNLSAFGSEMYMKAWFLIMIKSLFGTDFRNDSAS